MTIALQLYSVREEAQKDFVGCLQSVAKMNYEGVEFAGYGGLASRELRKWLLELNLLPISSHVSLEALRKELSGVIEYALELQLPRIVVPHPGSEVFEENTKAAWQKLADELNEIGDACRSAGIHLGYHNHSEELRPLPSGDYPLDVLFDHVDPGFVFAELDLGWVLYAGVDPIAYLERYATRCPLIHVKDFKGGRQVEVGLGDLNLPAVWRVAETIGVETLILETEKYTMPPLESVALGLANLKKARAL